MLVYPRFNYFYVQFFKYFFMNTKLSELVAQYQKANEGKEASIAVIKKKELLDTLSPMVGKENARKIYDLRRAILLSELEDTVKEFPILHKKQVIRLFEKCACVRKEDSIDGGRMMRPTLISLVEKLEAYTGRKITQDNDAPLRYLEDACDPDETITIEDIADYFSERKERKISKIYVIKSIRYRGIPYLITSKKIIIFIRRYSFTESFYRLQILVHIRPKNSCFA